MSTTTTTKWYTFRDLIFKVGTLLLLTVVILPSYRSDYSLPILATLEIVYAFVFFPKFYQTFLNVFWLILGYSLICFFIAIPFDLKMGLLHPFMTLWLWVFPIIMASELMKIKSFDTNRFVYMASLAILMIIIIATIKMMTENATIMRDMTSMMDEELVAEMNNRNVGGYGIAYGCGAILIALSGVVLTYKMRPINKYAALGLIGLLGVLVIMAQFTTLLIICCVVLCYQFTLFKGSLALKFGLMIGMLLLLLFSKDILSIIIDYYRGTVTAYHLKEIYDSIFGNSELDNSRAKYMANSINLFLSSPFWGNNVSSGANAVIVYESHSTIMTVLCKTGILGLTAYLGTYWKAFRPIYKRWDPRTKKIIGNSIIGYFLLLSFFNPSENDIFSYCIGLVAILTVYYFSFTKIKEYAK